MTEPMDKALFRGNGKGLCLVGTQPSPSAKAFVREGTVSPPLTNMATLPRRYALRLRGLRRGG